MVVFKDFPRSYRTPLRHLLKGGYARVPSMPGSRLELDFKDFEEYLTRKLSHKTRKNLRQKYRQAAASANLTMEVVTDIEPHIDEVFPLYRQVLERSHYKFEELTKSYFVHLGRRMGDRALFFIWRENGKAVAFSSCVGHQGTLRDTTSASITGSPSSITSTSSPSGTSSPGPCKTATRATTAPRSTTSRSTTCVTTSPRSISTCGCRGAGSTRFSASSCPTSSRPATTR